MNTREAAVVSVVVLLGVAGAALPTVAATTADAAVQANETNATDTDATGNDSGNESAAFGDQMTAFMQSSASETNDTVESGMWSAAFERANESEKARMAHDRTDTLEQRLERLRDRNRTLTERYENGSISRSEYVARSSELSGRIAALRTSIDETDRAAEKAGVNETRLDRLRTDARNVTGPKAAGVARGIVAGGQGPSDDRGPGPDAGPGNGVDPGNEATNASVDNGNQGGPQNSTGGADASDGSDGGENANPSDGGVGTGSNGDDPGEASSGAGNDGSTDANRTDEDADSNDGDDSGEDGVSSGDGGANPGNGNGEPGNDNGPSGPENGADDGNEAGTAGNGPNDYTGLTGFTTFP